MKYKELTEKIIGCAYKVYNKMGYGFLESVYEKCMLIEIKKIGLKAENQIPIKVYYDNEIVAELDIGLLINFGTNKVEIKRKEREFLLL